MNPLRLNSVYIKTIWAGDRLKKIRGLDSEIGISREVCAYKNSENIISEGEYKDQSIKEIIKNHHEELMGNDCADQLVRAAYIDAVDDLSIQVHPAEKYASKCGDYEKSESWYILEAEEGATICAGTTITDLEVLQKAAEEGTLEKYIKKVPVKEGDFALIPAGMLHACGKNMLAIEIGSFGGITYRLYDYGRGRELHLEKGFEVLDSTLTCSVTHHPLPDKPIDNESVGVDHPLFHVDVVDIAQEKEFKTNGHYCIIVCVKGNAELICDGGQFPLKYTQTLLVPQDVKKFRIEGNTRVLYAYHPVKK